MEKISKKQILTMSIWVLISAILQAFSFSSFSVGAGIYPSGVSGLSRLVSDVLLDFKNINLPFYYLYVLINLILAGLTFKHIGKFFTIFSLIQIVLVSLFSSILPQYHVLDDPLLIALFGGLLNGFGISLALTHDASSGGTDFISIYFSNKYHRSMWDYVFVFNAVIIFVAGIIYGWEKAAYSIIYQFVSNYVISHMHKRYTHEAIIIITRKPDEVIDSIFKNVHHGITKISAQGAYSGNDETMLYTVVNTFETADVVKYALQGDPKAFIETRKAKNVYGNYTQKPLN